MMTKKTIYHPDGMVRFCDSTHKRTVAEFFAGIGLMRMGLEKEGWKVEFANDISADKYDMYSDHFQDEKSHFILDDVRPRPPAEFILCHPEIVWNIRAVPALPIHSPALSDIVEDLSDTSPFWWNDARRDYLVNQMSERHAEQLKRMMEEDKWSYGTVFRRIRKGRSMAELRNDAIAGCLRTPRGGSGR